MPAGAAALHHHHDGGEGKGVVGSGRISDGSFASGDFDPDHHRHVLAAAGRFEKDLEAGDGGRNPFGDEHEHEHGHEHDAKEASVGENIKSAVNYM